jgi:hypothetical protein
MFNISEKDLHIIQEEMAPGTLRVLNERILELAFADNYNNFSKTLAGIREYAELDLPEFLIEENSEIKFSDDDIAKVCKAIEILQSYITPAIDEAAKRVAKQSTKRLSFTPPEPKPLSDKEKIELRARLEQGRIEREAATAQEQRIKNQEKSEIVDKEPVDLGKIEILTKGQQLSREEIIIHLGGTEQILTLLEKDKGVNKGLSLVKKILLILYELIFLDEITFCDNKFVLPTHDKLKLSSLLEDGHFTNITDLTTTLNSNLLPKLRNAINDSIIQSLSERKIKNLNNSMQEIKKISDQVFISLVNKSFEKSKYEYKLSTFINPRKLGMEIFVKPSVRLYNYDRSFKKTNS